MVKNQRQAKRIITAPNVFTIMAVDPARKTKRNERERELYSCDDII